jgi:5-methylcytosine-specific restriction endonuclease McrA
MTGEPLLAPGWTRQPRKKRRTNLCSTRRRAWRARLAEAQNHRCCYCGEPLLDEATTFEHVVPRSRGGRETWENLVLACRWCNEKRGDEDAFTFYHEFYDQPGRK